MPTIKKKKFYKKTNPDELSEDLRDWMLNEEGTFELDWEKLTRIEIQIGRQTVFDFLPCNGPEGYKKAWEKHRTKIMSLMGRDPGFPAGSRPAAWWRFDAPEQRRQLSGPAPMPADHQGSRYQFNQGLLAKGIPTCWVNMQDADSAVFETEYEYLERLNLLLPGEVYNIKSNNVTLEKLQEIEK